jgi:chromosome segregation ATPase
LANAQAQLSAAYQQLQNAQGQLNNAQANLQQRQREAEQIRNFIQREVEQDHRLLAQRVNEWQAFLQQAQSQVGQIQDRLNNILRYDLPRAQSSLRDFESRRPGAITEVQNAEFALADSTRAYNQYKQSVDYDNIKNEADRTAGVVRGIEATIAQHQRGIVTRRALIKEQTALRDSLNKRIADTNATIAKKEARLVDVDAALASYDIQKAEIQGRIDAAAAVLKEISDRYGATLN